LDDNSGLDDFVCRGYIDDLTQVIFNLNEIRYWEKDFNVYLLLDKKGIIKYKKMGITNSN